MKQIIQYNRPTLQLKLLDGTTKVFSDEEPLQSISQNSLAVFRNECVSFQVAYTCAGYRKDENYNAHFKLLKVRVESPILSAITLREVHNVPCQYPSHANADSNYLRKTAGLYPDRLAALEDDTVVFCANQWKSLWVDVTAAKNAVAGVYPIKILFEDEENKELACSIETEVEIMQPVLPDQTFPRTEWFYADCLADYYHVDVFSERHWEIIENFIAAAAKRGINMILTPQFTPPLDTAVGKERTPVQLVDVFKTADGYRFDFSKLRRWVEMCRRNGIRYFEMSHLFSQWGAVAAPAVMVEVDGEPVRLFGWDTPATGGEYTRFLHCYLPQLLAFLKEVGILENTYFHISDEPNLSQLDSYKAAMESIADVMQGCKFIEALSDYEFYRSGLVERPVCGTNHIKPFLEQNVTGLWSYYCTAQGVDVSNRFITMPAARTRIYGVQMFKFNIEGCLHWGYNFYNSMDSYFKIDPYRVTDCAGSYPSGDAFLVYPGADGMPEESIRMMLMDQAMSDLRALNYLSQLIGKEEVLKLVDTEAKQPLTFDRYPAHPADREYLLRLRSKVNRLICEHSKA